MIFLGDIAEDFSDIETKPRRFKGEPDADFHELLPVKVGGKLVKQSRLINKCDEDGMQEGFFFCPLFQCPLTPLS